jgi:hypothetical protein
MGPVDAPNGRQTLQRHGSLMNYAWATRKKNHKKISKIYRNKKKFMLKISVF